MVLQDPHFLARQVPFDWAFVHGDRVLPSSPYCFAFAFFVVLASAVAEGSSFVHFEASVVAFLDLPSFADVEGKYHP